MTDDAGRYCGQKVRHMTRRRAKDVLKMSVRTFGHKASDWDVYRCPSCGQWHIGHRPVWRRDP